MAEVDKSDYKDVTERVFELQRTMVALSLLLLPTAAAFPAFAGLGADDIAALDERASIFDPLKYQGINLWDSLGGVFRAMNYQDITGLTNAVTEGIRAIEADAHANPKFGGFPVAQLVDVPRDQLTKDAIYEAYKLDRSIPPIWGEQEDEEHPWIAPGPGDIRGPCPGLNTLANHGYLPRNGICTPQELMMGVWKGLSMSPELSGILAIAGVVWKADIKTLKISIGAGTQGTGVGLSNHGFIEGDASVTRDDSIIGDQVHVNETKLHRYYDIIHRLGTNGYDINPEVCAESRYVAWKDSVDSNHAMDFNPLRHLVAYAESAFAMEVFRGQNQSCTSETIDWFFVRERFPPGWSRRNVPVSTNEMFTWALLFNSIRTVYPGYTLGRTGAFYNFPLAQFGGGVTNFLSPSSLRVNACKFVATFAIFVPTGLMQFSKGLGDHFVKGFACS